MANGIDLQITENQRDFMFATQDEVLYGGAAGGGKSYGQIVDAFVFALEYPGSKQLILRRTYPELEKSIIRETLRLYPKDIFKYNSSQHTGKLKNGSIIDYGYLAKDKDVFKYQSVEYDVIRFDELTHFQEFQYVYLLSRLRGANKFPKQVKSTANPGGVGHAWVKKRFIDPAPPRTEIRDGSRSRIFIPSRVHDNLFLMAHDPAYVERLKALPEQQRRALLEGDWNVFEGQYFTEFSLDIHVCKPFAIPSSWRRFRTVDYGLDRYACLWVAIDGDGDVYVYKEYAHSNLIISEAAAATRRMSEKEDIYATLAPPDLWQRSQESGRSKALMFAENGIRFTKTPNDRETGWLAIKELLKVREDGTAKLHIFETCRELITCLPQLQHDPKRPTDTATEPHEITHICDALRGFAIYYARPAESVDGGRTASAWPRDLIEDYRRASEEERARMIEKYGYPEEI